MNSLFIYIFDLLGYHEIVEEEDQITEDEVDYILGLDFAIEDD